MFDLASAVHQWAAFVLSNDSIKNRNIDELKDHLYCEVEKYITEGMKPEEAFNKAISTIGERSILAIENQKNKNFIDKLCAFEYGTIGRSNKNKGDDMISRKQMHWQQSVLWAVAIIACAIILKGTPQASSVILFVLVPLALASIIMLGSKSNPYSMQCILGKIKKMLTS